MSDDLISPGGGKKPRRVHGLYGLQSHQKHGKGEDYG